MLKRPDQSLALSSILPTWAKAEAHIAQHLPYVMPWGDRAILLRDGDLMGVIRVRGLNADLAEANEVEGLRKRMEAVILASGRDVGFYIHRISTKADIELSFDLQPESFVDHVDKRWKASLQNAGLMTRTYYLSIIIRPDPLQKQTKKFRRGDKRALARERLEGRAEILEEICSEFISTLAMYGAKRLTVIDGDLLGFVAGLCSHEYHLLGGPLFADVLSKGLPARRVTFRGDRIELHGMDTEPSRHGAILSITKYGGATYAGAFEALDLPIEMVTTNSFTPMPSAVAAERIQRTVRQMRSTDDAAMSLLDELHEAADDVESGRQVFGQHHMTCAVYADTPKALDAMVAEVRHAAQAGGAVMTAEGYASRAAWFAQHPGNFSYRARALILSATNFVDMSSFHGRPEGRPAEKTPWGRVLSEIPTANAECYKLNIHGPGSPHHEPSAGHSVVLGATNAGKSTATAFLMAQARRLNARVIVFDKDHSLEMPTRAMGGKYTTMRAGQAPGLNPFASEFDQRGVSWLADWVAALLEKKAHLSPMQTQAIAMAALENAKFPELRSVANFAEHFRSVDDNGDLIGRMSEWLRGGRYGWVFDGDVEDSLTLDGDLIAFDMSELLDMDLERTAVLAYLFRRIERLTEDRRPTLIIMEEAWRLLDDDYFADRLKNWMLTLRKMNTALMMLTQQVSHLEESKAGRSIMENVVTRMVFPNPGARAQDYAQIGLNTAECEAAVTAGIGRQLLVKSAGESVMLDIDLSALGPALTILGGGPSGERLVGTDWRENPKFWKKAMKDGT